MAVPYFTGIVAITFPMLCIAVGLRVVVGTGIGSYVGLARLGKAVGAVVAAGAHAETIAHTSYKIETSNSCGFIVFPLARSKILNSAFDVMQISWRDIQPLDKVYWPVQQPDRTKADLQIRNSRLKFIGRFDLVSDWIESLDLAIAA